MPSEEKQGAGRRQVGRKKAEEAAHQSLGVIISEQVGAMEGQILTRIFKDFTLAVRAGGRQLRVTETPKGVFSEGPLAMTLERPES